MDKKHHRRKRDARTWSFRRNERERRRFGNDADALDRGANSAGQPAVQRLETATVRAEDMYDWAARIRKRGPYGQDIDTANSNAAAPTTSTPMQSTAVRR